MIRKYLERRLQSVQQFKGGLVVTWLKWGTLSIAFSTLIAGIAISWIASGSTFEHVAMMIMCFFAFWAAFFWAPREVRLVSASFLFAFFILAVAAVLGSIVEWVFLPAIGLLIISAASSSIMFWNESRLVFGNNELVRTLVLAILFPALWFASGIIGRLWVNDIFGVVAAELDYAVILATFIGFIIFLPIVVGFAAFVMYSISMIKGRDKVGEHNSSLDAIKDGLKKGSRLAIIPAALMFGSFALALAAERYDPVVESWIHKVAYAHDFQRDERLLESSSERVIFHSNSLASTLSRTNDGFEMRLGYFFIDKEAGEGNFHIIDSRMLGQGEGSQGLQE